MAVTVHPDGVPVLADIVEVDERRRKAEVVGSWGSWRVLQLEISQFRETDLLLDDTNYTDRFSVLVHPAGS